MAGPTTGGALGHTGAGSLTPGSTVSPFVPVAIVFRKRAWTDDWTRDDDLWCSDVQLNVASVGDHSATLRRPYGPETKLPNETAYRARAPYDVANGLAPGDWVQVSLTTKGAPKPIFCGRVNAPVRRIDGSSGTRAPQGEQVWHVTGPGAILDQIDFGYAWWRNNQGLVVKVDVTADFNRAADDTLTAVGNRYEFMQSPADAGGRPRWIFGGNEKWSHKKAAEYLIESHVYQGSTQPDWSLGGLPGALAYLDQLETRMPVGESCDNVGRMLRRLMTVEEGLDYAIVLKVNAEHFVTGFEVFAFPMLNEEITLGGYTFPSSTTLSPIKGSSMRRMRVEVEESIGQKYDRIVIRGARIVSTFSLAPPGGIYGIDQWETKWSSAAEALYKSAVGAGDANEQKNDVYRAGDRFRAVYQRFAAATDFNWGPSQQAHIAFNDDGTFGYSTNFSGKQRRTLGRLALKEGVNYTQSPPVDLNPSDVRADWLPLLAIVRDPETGGWVPVEKLDSVRKVSASVSPLENEYGVQLNSTWNHAFARNHWAGANPSLFDPEEGRADELSPDPIQGVDYNQMYITLSVLMDAHMQVAVQLPPTLSSKQGLTQILDYPEAEFHWLAPYTVLGVDNSATPQLVVSPAATTGQPNVLGIITRDDRPFLLRKVAGAVGRYLRTRARAVITLFALEPRDATLGRFVNAVVEGDGDLALANLIGGAVTGIEWDFQQRTTTMRCGQAVT